MSPAFGAEAPTVQNPILSYVSESANGLQWSQVDREQAEERRNGIAGVFFYDSLRQKLLEFNDWMDDPLAKEVIKRMEIVRPTIEGNQELLSWLRGRQSIHHAKARRERNVTLIDFHNPANNTFEVTEEWQYTNGRFTNRADIVFLINGIPVILVEAKAAHKDEGVAEGVEQIRRYHEETPEMVTINQIFDVPNLLDWYYGVTWNTDRKNLFNWREDQPGNFENKIKSFFQRDRILKFIQDYILFIKSDDELQKYILRQHQTRAIEKGVSRSLDTEKRTGLFWHTQGSGKTFTMIVTAKKLLDQPELEKPTVLMLVDRNELETQLFQNLEGYGFGDVKFIESKADLRDTLKQDRRGLIVSMIHKFEGVPKDICLRENVFVLVDEAHRSTGGDLGNYLMAALPNATFLGFTGTPIAKTAYGKGTFKTFGREDAPKGYLDKYSMAESIEDGTTLPLHYTLAPNDMLVNQETLSKEFLDLAESQGVSDVEELNRILDRAVTLKTQMKAQDRVEKVAKFVARHFKENVEPMGYKAFLVAVDREACALYKKALDNHLQRDYSEVVYSPSHNDRELLKGFHLSGQQEKDVRKAFKRMGDNPKILIVTDKLLTGFNAPILYCMYLDKPMRDHILLQSIARINRPYEDGEGRKKPVGFILDFVGIFEKLDNALDFDSDEVASVIQDIELLRNEFERLMQEKACEYLPLVKGKSTDKDFEEALEYFSQKEKREEFFKLFKTIEAFYEILSPDAFLGPYIEDYNLLARLYVSLRNAYKKRIYLDRELLAKTRELVQQNVTAEGFSGTLPIQAIDENTLDALKKSKSTDHIKVINLIKTIRITIEEEGEQNPFLISIGEKADAIAEMYEGRQINTERALRMLEELIREYNEAFQEWKEKGLDVNTFSLYWVLQKSGVKNAEKLAGDVEGVFNSNSNWKVNPNEHRNLKRELYKILMKPTGKDRIKELVEQLLRVR